MPVDPTQPLVDAALTLLALWFVCTFAAAWIHGRGTRVAGTSGPRVTRVAGSTSHQVDAERLADGQSAPSLGGHQGGHQVDADHRGSQAPDTDAPGYQWSPDVYDNWLS